MKLSSRTGFTLLELLVVVAIIGILATLLFPMTGRVLESGRRTACRKNIEQLHLAFIQFSMDNNGFYPWTSNHASPDAARAGNNGSMPNQRTLNFMATNLYGRGLIMDTRTWICKSDRRDGADNATPVVAAEDFSKIQSIGNISYMVVIGYDDRKFSNPSRYPVIADESNRVENGPASAGNMPQITAVDNHGANFRNVVFLDGHVEALEKNNVANAIFDDLDRDGVAGLVASRD